MSRFFTYIAMSVLLAGCSNTKELVFGEKGNIGTIFWNSEKSCVVGIGSPKDPYDNSPKLQIRIDNTVIFDSKNNNLKHNSLYLESNKKLPASNRRSIGGHPVPRCLRSNITWGENTYAVTIFSGPRQTVEILVKNGTVQSIYIADFNYNDSKSVIWLKVDDFEWHDIHLGEEECIRLFGTPYKQHNYFTE